ncbi:MAG: hypothetical protein AAF399_17990 [Bacteroidota bacterium]
MLVWIVGFIGCGWQIVWAQPKYEQEYRIRPSEVPEAAASFLQEIGWSSKIKWYREEGLNQTSIEAKVKEAGSRYSVEFDSTGQLQDVEMLITEEEIPEETLNKIEGFLQKEHDKHRYRRIQRQFTGKTAAILQQLQVGEATSEVVIRYEVVVKTRTGKRHEWIEYLFSETGELLRTSPIVLRRTDHLEF